MLARARGRDRPRLRGGRPQVHDGIAPAGALPLDAAYSPITRVSYNVEMSRLGKITDYEKLVVEVWTNGSREARRGAGAGRAVPAAITSARSRRGPRARTRTSRRRRRRGFLREALGKTLEELPLPARAINALKNADDAPGRRPRPEDREPTSSTSRTSGEKSIDEIKTALASLGLSLGMRIDPNVLGRSAARTAPVK